MAEKTTEQVIEYRIDGNGNVNLEVINGDGAGCEGLLAKFSAFLGKVVEHGHTEDHGRRRRRKERDGRARVRS